MMSQSFYFRPTKQKILLQVDAPSHFRESMVSAFGCQPPWLLGEHAIPILRGMAAVDRQQSKPFLKLAEKLEQNGEIEVWAES